MQRAVLRSHHPLGVTEGQQKGQLGTTEKRVSSKRGLTVKWVYSVNQKTCLTKYERCASITTALFKKQIFSFRTQFSKISKILKTWHMLKNRPWNKSRDVFDFVHLIQIFSLKIHFIKISKSFQNLTGYDETSISYFSCCLKMWNKFEFLFHIISSLLNK